MTPEITPQSSNQEVREAVAWCVKRVVRDSQRIDAVVAFLEAERGAALRSFTAGSQKAAPKDSVAYSNRPKDEPKKWARVSDSLLADRHGFTRLVKDLSEEQRLEVMEDLGYDPVDGAKKEGEAE